MTGSKLKHFVVTILLIAAVVFSATGYFEKAAGWLGADKISSFNEKYLEESFDKAMSGFLVLSAIKSGLAIIEGSEVGVGFNVEVGDVVQSVYDYVDVAWKTALTGGTVLVLMQLVLQAVALINHWSLAFLFLLFLGIYLFHMFSKNDHAVAGLLKNSLAFLTILTIALYLILPVSIWGASWLSGEITNPLIAEAHDGFSSMKEDLSAQALTEKLFRDMETRDDSWMSRLNLNAKYDQAKKHLAELGLYFKDLAEQMAIWTIKLIAGYLFDCLIFPTTFFLCLYVFTKFTVNYLFGINVYKGRLNGKGFSPALGS